MTRPDRVRSRPGPRPRGNVGPAMGRRLPLLAFLAAALVLLAACSDGGSGGPGLRVAVSGLPDGTPASITVASDHGDVVQVGRSERLAGFGAGRYTVRADAVALGGVSYEPDPASQVIDVDGDAVRTVTVAYDAAAGGARAVLGGAGPAGVTRGTTVQGVLWSDRDGDGRFGPGDAVLPGVPVHLDLDGDGEADPDEPATVSDRAGQYRFAGLASGMSFTLRHAASAGFVSVAAPAGAGASSLRTAAADIDAATVQHHVWH